MRMIRLIDEDDAHTILPPPPVTLNDMSEGFYVLVTGVTTSGPAVIGTISVSFTYDFVPTATA